MKKSTFLAVLVLLSQLVFAGGLLTNGNQSAQYIRMMSRNASLGIDAVYYNPAGLIKLDDGWHFALHNQTIFQTKTVDSQFGLLNDGYYEGAVNVPYFPTAFIVYKKNNLALSFGFGPNGGGGTADYDRGLPSFEIPITKLGAGLNKISPLLSPYQIPAVTGYDAVMSFEGSSVFYGLQLGATYKVSDFLSVYGGIRLLPSQNTYFGEITNIKVRTAGDPISADTYLNTIAPIITPTIQALGTAAGGLQAAIDAGMLDPGADVTNPQILPYLQLLGYPSISNQQAVALLESTKNSLQGLMDADVSDKKVDAQQTGFGFTPMIGINISPVENLNIGLKYEMQTKLELTNSTKVDDVGLFPDGETSRSDLPAILGIGVGYQAGKLEAQFSYTMFFDKGVSWGGNTRDIAIYKELDPDMIRAREIDKNGFEAGLGLQYNVTDKFALSIGGLRSNLGVAESFQNDFDNNNSSYSLGGGLEWKITDALVLDAGVLKSFYKDETVSFTDPDMGTYKETYGKNTTGFAIGLSYSIF
jgi:long-chain fatty acid transport protein